MSRLLFAAARGARIEYQCNATFEWKLASRVDTIAQPPEPPGIRPREYKWRIHPDDTHLQYGPISTALREFAEKPPVYAGVVGFPVWGHIYKDLKQHFVDGKRRNRLYYEHVDELHRSMFLLILAEALADEGL